MFFEGCPAHLGCTIKLRGAAEYELARVKEIIMLMVCVAYHSQLEISFLMDEFAMPPSLGPPGNSFPCLLEGSTAEEEEEEEEEEEVETPKRVEEDGGVAPEGSDGPWEEAEAGVVVAAAAAGGGGGERDAAGEPGGVAPAPALEPMMSKLGEVEEEALLNPVSSSSPRSVVEGDEEVVPAETVTSATSSSTSSTPPNPVSSSSTSAPTNARPPPLAPFLEAGEEDLETLSRPSVEEDEEEEEGSSAGTGETLCAEEEKDSDTPPPAPPPPPPRLFRDPLQDDTGMFVAEKVASCDDRLKSISAAFKQELKDIILCISPFIRFREPFLLTPAGLHCPSRDYFPEQVLPPGFLESCRRP